MVSKKSLENLKKGKKFGPDNPPRNGGRKKSQLKDFMIKEEFSLADMRKVFQGIIFTHSVAELNDMVKNDTTLPTPVTALISAFLHDIKHGNLNAMNFVMDRLYGKAKETFNHEISSISTETIAALNSLFTEKTEIQTHGKKTKAKR